MSSFPLLRLPLVPIRSTLDVMDLSDRIRLSMSNRKIHQFVKAAGKPLSIESFSDKQQKNMRVLDQINLILLEIHTDSDEYRTTCEVFLSDDLLYAFNVAGVKPLKYWFSFFIYVNPKRRQKRCEGTKGMLKIGNAKPRVGIEDSNQMLHTFWSSKVKAIQTIGDWFKQIFKTQFDLSIKNGTRKNYSENLRFIVNWINSTYQNNVKNCYIRNYDISDEDLKFVLDNMHPTGSLSLSSSRKFEFHHNPQIKTGILNLELANWFTFENLSMAECQTIYISDSRLTTDDFIEYLKQWLTGKFSTLRRLDVITREKFNFEQIINGLSIGQVIVDGKLEKYFLIRNGDSISLHRNDGMVARILTAAGKVNSFDMKVSTSFIASS